MNSMLNVGRGKFARMTTRGFAKARAVLFAKSSNNGTNTKILRYLTSRITSIKPGEDILAGSRGESFHGDGGSVQVVVVVCLAHLLHSYNNRLTCDLFLELDKALHNEILYFESQQQNCSNPIM